MIHFTPLTLSDYPALQPFFEADTLFRRTCDHTPAITFLWRSFFETEYAIAADTLLMRARYTDGSRMYTVPIGQNPAKALRILHGECRGQEEPLRFCFAAREDLPLLLDVFGDARVQPTPQWYDYLYDRTAFCSLAGKKYHGQRNFVNRFQKLFPAAEAVPITEENAACALRFVREQYAHSHPVSPMAAAEQDALLELFQNWSYYGLRGLMLTAEGKTVGITAGSTVRDTLFVHFEKADTSYPGAYPTLAVRFAASFDDPGLIWLNREEDLGEENLRRAKQAWHPARLIEKYTVLCP